MVVELDLLYLYLASFLTSASASTSFLASEVNISNSHNSLIFQARRPKFCMVVDLDLLYLFLASFLTSASASASEVNILNSHNSLIFKARRLKFCMVVDLDLLYVYLVEVPILGMIICCMMTKSV